MKIHVSSGNGSELAGSHDEWKDWIDQWIPDDLDLIVERYDPNKGMEHVQAARQVAGILPDSEISISDGPIQPPNRLSSMLRRVQTNGEASISALPKPKIVATVITTMQPSRFNFKPNPVDPRTAEALRRRTAAQDSFNKQVQEARQHAANVMAKIGNAK